MNPFPRIVLLLTLTFLIFSTGIFARDKTTWRPVTPAELAMDKPQVDPNADAEAIFWEIRLDDKKRKKMSYEHYVRVKIFTERGRERFAKFDIPFFKGKKVENVAARVIKPDGTIINLQPQDIFEREIVKQRKVKIKAKSFAVPGIAPGVIVEYQYEEIIKGDSLNGERLYFQRDIPLQKVTYYLRPYKGLNLKIKPRNMQLGTVDKTSDGFYVARMEKVPAFKEEPRMPPDNEVRRWAYLSYGPSINPISVSFFALGFGGSFAKLIKPDKTVRAKAKEITANASTNKEKLKAIYDFTQNQIKNLSFDKNAGGGRKIKIKKSSDVLKYGMGTAGDIDILFASLAEAAGFKPRLVLSGDRSVNFFNPNRDPVDQTTVHPACIVVEVDGEQIYANPGTPYLPFGKLIWFEEHVNSLQVNAIGYDWKKTPLSSYEASRASKIGKFSLTEDGVLEGTVEVEYKGNLAVDRRREGINETAEKRIEDYLEELKESVPTGEYTDIKIEHFESPSDSLKYSYKMRIPNYAVKTGKRMFIQPAVFQFNSKPEFSSSSRIHPIYFKYPWSEIEEVEIKLPDSYAIEDTSPPKDIREKSRFAGTSYSVDYDAQTNTLKFKRNFFFGGKQKILFPKESYQPLKRLFDLFHKSDTHTFLLIRK